MDQVSDRGRLPHCLRQKDTAMKNLDKLKALSTGMDRLAAMTALLQRRLADGITAETPPADARPRASEALAGRRA
jgi:hypothetical protein